jgi:hypothetical protein
MPVIDGGRTITTMSGKPDPREGCVLVVNGHCIGRYRRIARITELTGEPAERRFQVQWEDGHESVVSAQPRTGRRATPAAPSAGPGRP